MFQVFGACRKSLGLSDRPGKPLAAEVGPAVVCGEPQGSKNSRQGSEMLQIGEFHTSQPAATRVDRLRNHPFADRVVTVIWNGGVVLLQLRLRDDGIVELLVEEAALNNAEQSSDNVPQVRRSCWLFPLSDWGCQKKRT